MDGKYDPQTLSEIEKVKQWLNMDDPISIVTHQKVDADAAFSAALLKILRPYAAWVLLEQMQSLMTKDRLQLTLAMERVL